jgi:hypothetical protein
MIGMVAARPSLPGKFPWTARMTKLDTPPTRTSSWTASFTMPTNSSCAGNPCGPASSPGKNADVSRDNMNTVNTLLYTFGQLCFVFSSRSAAPHLPRKGWGKLPPRVALSIGVAWRFVSASEKLT